MFALPAAQVWLGPDKNCVEWLLTALLGNNPTNSIDFYGLSPLEFDPGVGSGGGLDPCPTPMPTPTPTRRGGIFTPAFEDQLGTRGGAVANIGILGLYDLLTRQKYGQKTNKGQGPILNARTPPNPHGMLGKPSTRKHMDDVVKEMEKRGWKITAGGGKLKEEYLPGPGGKRLGSSRPDITATKNGRTLRVNTVTTRADGVTPDRREATNAARIRKQKPGEHLLLIPKP